MSLHRVFRDAELPLTREDRLSQWAAKKAYVPELRAVSTISFDSPTERALRGLRAALESFALPDAQLWSARR